MKEHFKLLGFRVREVVSGHEGIVTSISFDLNGCVQGLVMAPRDKKTGKLGESFWFDTKRLEALDKKAIRPLPTFEVVPGGQDLPAFLSKPTS